MPEGKIGPSISYWFQLTVYNSWPLSLSMSTENLFCVFLINKSYTPDVRGKSHTPGSYFQLRTLKHHYHDPVTVRMLVPAVTRWEVQKQLSVEKNNCVQSRKAPNSVKKILFKVFKKQQSIHKQGYQGKAIKSKVLSPSKKNLSTKRDF